MLVNDAFCRMYGFAEAELIGQPIKHGRSSRTPAKRGRSRAAGYDGGTAGGTVEPQGSGSHCFPPQRLRMMPGHTVALIGVASDITECSRVEAERQQLQVSSCRPRRTGSGRQACGRDRPRLQQPAHRHQRLQLARCEQHRAAILAGCWWKSVRRAIGRCPAAARVQPYVDGNGGSRPQR